MKDNQDIKQKIHPLRLFCAACSYTSVQIAYGFAFALWSPLMQSLLIITLYIVSNFI